MKIIFSSLAFLLFSTAIVAGQESQDKNAGLKIGDQVPDVELNFVANAIKEKRLSDLRGKIVFMDFWATWCGACIVSMPKAYQLQREFPDAIQILLVNKDEPLDLIEKFITKRNSLPSRVTLPVVMGDSTIRRSFTQRGLPLIYWIDRAGIVKNITIAESLTSTNVKSFIASDKDVSTVKETSNVVKSPILWKTEIAQDASGNNFAMLRALPDGKLKLNSYHSSMIDLFRFSYGTLHNKDQKEKVWVEMFPVSRVLLETGDRKNLGRHASNNVHPDTTYAYTLDAPEYTTPEKMLTVMKYEIGEWFGYSATIEKRKTKYLSLEIPDSTKLLPEAGKRKATINDVDIEINGMTITQLIRMIDDYVNLNKNYLPPFPIINEAMYKGKLNGISINGVNISNEKYLDKALSRFGVRLTPKEKMMEVLVIRKNQNL